MCVVPRMCNTVWLVSWGYVPIIKYSGTDLDKGLDIPVRDNKDDAMNLDKGLDISIEDEEEDLDDNPVLEIATMTLEKEDSA